ncbi:hypothetical protein BCR34DRAFT_558554 [Clohesyomyces aquaticus]|uniref:Uncharacterized protein n=1 Tax=Clohesyomyces aquaticus TaxID=1231657 RepID=A0A1Y1ZZ43_9PLEO|nr:hypothetical protein BCR34DRAFT_558554 [Clohesyomyces aquaticus]
MKLSTLNLIFVHLSLLHSTLAIQVDCSMADTTPCDCIHPTNPNLNLPGTDCRVCRVVGELNCVLWGTNGMRYGPLCEDPTCPPYGTSTKCACDWKPKFHERLPCTSPGGECKCHPPNTNITIPGEKCEVCVENHTSGDVYWCGEKGNAKNRYGPLCLGEEFSPNCTGKGGCVCFWYPGT